MNNLNKAIVALVIGSGLAGTAYYAQAKEAKSNDAIDAITATVTLDNAVMIAQQHVPGIAVSAEFESDDGKALWEVEIVAEDHQVYDLEIDATTGELMKQELDQNDNEEDDSDEDDSDERDDD